MSTLASLCILFIALVSAGINRDPRYHRARDGLIVDIQENLSWGTRTDPNAKSRCMFFVWQKDPGFKLLGMSVSIGAGLGSNYGANIRFNQPSNPDKPLYFTTSCGDALWVDTFEWSYSGSIRYYGASNSHGWCISKDRNDWRAFGWRVPARRCFTTVELETFNEAPAIGRGSRVFGYFGATHPFFGRRVLESGSSMDPFEATLELFAQCVQTLGDNDVCKGLSGSAMDFFDEEKFMLISQNNGEEAQSVEPSGEDESEDTMDSNDRRKL